MPLSKDTLFYSIANWSTRIVGFIVAPVLIHFFTPEMFGKYNLIISIGTFCSILSLLAIVDQGLPRFFLDSKDEEERRSYVSTSFVICSVGLAITTILIFLSTPIVPFLLKDVKTPLIFTLLVAIICFSKSILYMGSNMLKWTFQSPLFTKITLAQTVVGAILIISSVVFLGWRAEGVLVISATVALGAGIWASHAIKNYIKLSSFSKEKLKELVLYAWPMLGLNIFAFFTRSLDRFFLAALASFGAVGIFSVSFSVASLFETLISGFFFAWGPHVLSTFKEPDAPNRYASYFSLTSCLGIISIITLGLWGSPIVMLIRPDGAYQEIGVFIPWIVSGTLLYYLGGYFSPGPMIAKKTYLKFIGFIIAATINALLNYILIPILGILGAGIATATSSLIAGAYNQIISNRLFFVPNRWIFSFTYILIITSVVSFSQHNKFMGIFTEEFSYMHRIVFTIVLIILGSLPFYRDIKNAGFLNKISTLILNRGH